jgi:hypothetical protein
MKRPYIPLLSFLILLLLTISFSFDPGASVVTGWHVTINPPHFIWGPILVAIFLFLIIGYWLLVKRVDKVNWVLFVIHFLLTIPTVVFLIFPSIFLNEESLFLDPGSPNAEKLWVNLSLRIKLMPVAWTVFTIGQILFMVYYIRTIKRIRVVHKPAISTPNHSGLL